MFKLNSRYYEYICDQSITWFFDCRTNFGQLEAGRRSPALCSLCWESSRRLNELARSVCAQKVENGGGGGSGFNYLELPAALSLLLSVNTHPNKFIPGAAVEAVDFMKTHSLTRPFAHCSRALLSPPLYIQNKSRTSNKVVVRLLMELDLPSRTGAGTKRCRQIPRAAQSPKSLAETHGGVLTFA